MDLKHLFIIVVNENNATNNTYHIKRYWQLLATITVKKV